MTEKSQTTTPGAFISADEANGYIARYADEVTASGNDQCIKSYIIDADLMREYLNNCPDVKYLQVSLGKTDLTAPTMPLGPGHNFIFVGVNSTKNYVLYNGDVLDNGDPCPNNCSYCGPVIIK